MKPLLLAFLLSSALAALSQPNLPPKALSPLGVRQIHSGHSLTDPLFHPWPGQFVTLVGMELGAWAGDIVGKSTTPGSPMWWRWHNPPGWGAPDARHDIPNWELLCITEGVPLYYEGGSTQQWYINAIDSQRYYLSLFVNNAWTNGAAGAGAPTLLWTTWTNIDDSDGPWRPMLDILGEEWENMQDYANEHRPQGAPHVYLIPGHKMMARLYDDIQLGAVPGVSDISFFFSDNIHVNNYGSYAVALIHYACIFGKNPAGLTNDLVNSGGSTEPVPSPELAAYLQEMIWDVVTTYPRTGLFVEPSAAVEIEASAPALYLSPNPAHQSIQARFSIPAPGSARLELLNGLGQPVFQKDLGVLASGEYAEDISVAHLPEGIYFVRLQVNGNVAVEKALVFRTP
jgi:hypothetical protein